MNRQSRRCLLAWAALTVLAPLTVRAADPPKRVAYIHGDVAADGTIPSGASPAYDPMLLTDTGPKGLSAFRSMVEAEGYQIGQHYDQTTTLDAAFLGPFDAVIFGLHQKIWSAPEKAALDTWLRAGGGIMVYSDSAAGGAFNIVGIKNPVGQNAVNNLITAYGMQVTVDQGGGTRAYTAGSGASHPVVAGPLVIEGEGVSPVALDPASGAVALIPFNVANRVSGSNLNLDTQGVSIVNPEWASLALQEVDGGRILALFDRQPLWNSGPGSDIAKRDNWEILRRAVRFLAGDSPLPPTNSAPAIELLSTLQTGNVGTETVLGATVTGSPEPSLQWFRRGNEIDGATGPMLTLSPVTWADAGEYTLVASNEFGTTTSDPVVLTVMPPGALPPIPRDNLVAEWLFEEAGGWSAADTSGAERHGTLVNAERIDGVLGGGVSFNGSNASVQVAPFDIAGTSLTLSLWMRHDGTVSRDARFVSKAASTSSAQNYWKIGPHDNRRLRARVRVGGVTHEINTPNEIFEFGRWHHIALIYDGGAVRVLVDGHTKASMPASGALDTAATVGVALGDQPTGTGSRAFEGVLDQVRFYSRALSAPDISALVAEPHIATPQTAFEHWIARLPDAPPESLREPLDDPDDDGIPNLLEYACGGHPGLPHTARLPTFLPAASSGQWIFAYFKAVPDLIYTVEYSTTLAADDWLPTGGSEQFNPADGTHFRAISTPSDASRGFVRLRVDFP